MKKIIHRDLLKVLPSSIIKLDDVFVNFKYFDMIFPNDFPSRNFYSGYDQNLDYNDFLADTLKTDDYISSVAQQYINLLIQLKGVQKVYKGYCDTYNDEYSKTSKKDFKQCLFIDLKSVRDYIDIYRVLKDDTFTIDAISFHFVLK